MSNEIIERVGHIPIKVEPRTISVTDKGKYFEHVDNLELNQTINISTNINGNLVTSNIYPNNEFYNLFVLDGEDFSKGYFIMKNDLCLKYIDKSISNKYSLSNKESINECLRYPCLFANKNTSYKKTKDEQLAYFGYLAGIQFTGEGCKFSFSIVSSLQQNIFNDKAKVFDLKSCKGENELDHIHWSIKSINIVYNIRALGFNVAAY